MRNTKWFKIINLGIFQQAATLAGATGEPLSDFMAFRKAVEGIVHTRSIKSPAGAGGVLSAL